jgi:hypothetical protein
MLDWLKAIFDARETEDFHTLYTDSPISFAEHFPEVPLPDSDIAPQLLAARWAARDVYGEDMPPIAADLLKAGYDSPALHRLAEEDNIAHSPDLEQLLATVFHDLSAQYPLTEDEANHIFIRQVAREVIAGKRNVWAAANHVSVMLRGRFADDPDLAFMNGLLNPLNWEDVSNDDLPAMTQELAEAFARLGAQTDREKQLASSS